MIKNKFIQRSTAIILVFLMLLINLQALSVEYLLATPHEFSTELPISEFLSLHQRTFWDDNTINQTNYFEYTPNSNIVPICAYGNKLYGRSTISEVSDYLQSNGYSVIGGINGDFYTLATGLPSGIVIRNNELISSDGWQYGVGFRADGSAFIGKPELKITAHTDSKEIPITSINKLRTNVGVYLLTDDFSSLTRISSPGTNIVLSAEDDTLVVGKDLSATVESISFEENSTEIPKGKIILTADSSVSDLLSGISVGDNVTISITASDESWNTADFAIGGGVLLLKDGKIQEQKNTSVNPRTAVGIKKDGTCIFYTVDGRQGGYSSGMSLEQLAKELKSLGCVDAINMDGGGSTTSCIRYPDQTAVSVINRPSDGTLRKNANFILFVTKSSTDNDVESIYIKPENRIALPGTTLNFETFGLNNSYNTVELDYEPTAYADSNLGLVIDSGTVRLDKNATSGNIYATFGKLTAKAPITITNTFDTMTIVSDDKEISTINLAYEQELDLDVIVSYKGRTIASSDDVFSWQLSNNLVGTIDSNGVLKAGSNGSFGTLTITGINNMYKTIPIKVGHATEILEDFENQNDYNFKTNLLYEELVNQKNSIIDTDENSDDSYSIEQDIGSVTPNIDLDTAPLSYSKIENNQQFVRYGNGSLKVFYDFSDLAFDASTEDTLIFKFGNAVPSENAKIFDLWVYGDSSSNSISLSGKTNDGIIESIGAYSVDFDGWPCLRFEFDKEISNIESINIIQNYQDIAEQNGTLYFDNITAIFDDSSEDIIAPEIQLKREIKKSDGFGSFNQVYDLNSSDVEILAGDVVIISGNIIDNSGSNILNKNVSAKLDENSYNINFSQDDCQFFTELDTSDMTPGLHKITITAKDSSGNIGRETWSFTLINDQRDDSFFIDTDKHWSKNFAQYLADNAILTGETTPDGFAFRPDRPATRLETAIIMSRYLQLDTEAYADTELTFIDNDSIPLWALDYVKAVYSEGIMLGKQSPDGTRFAGNEYITRAEAMTLFGRTLEQGFELKQCIFNDSKTIPSWASPYIKKLYSLGIINGYSSDNTIRPQNTITRAEIASILFKL